MKQKYIDAVTKSKFISREKKAEIIRDLDEIFDESLLHGETETELECRLGTPEVFAAGFENPGQVVKKKIWPAAVPAAVFGVSFLTAFVYYISLLIRTSFIFGLDKDLAIIGGAEGPTHIFVTGSQTGTIAAYVLLGVGVLVLGGLAVFFGIRFIKRMR